MSVKHTNECVAKLYSVVIFMSHIPPPPLHLLLHTQINLSADAWFLWEIRWAAATC